MVTNYQDIDRDNLIILLELRDEMIDDLLTQLAIARYNLAEARQGKVRDDNEQHSA